MLESVTREVNPGEPVRKRELKSSDGSEEYLLMSLSKDSRSRPRGGISSEQKGDDNSTLAVSYPHHGVNGPSLSSTSHQAPLLRPSSRLTTGSRALVDGWTLLSPEPGSQTGSQPTGRLNSQGVIDPPRHPKEGHEWVWFAEGYWAEREKFELPRDSKRNGRSPWKLRSQERASQKTNESDQQTLRDIKAGYPSGLTTVTGSQQGGFYDSISAPSVGDKTSKIQNSKLRRGLQYMSPTYPHFVSPEGEPEGLYCKSKRGIGIGGTSSRRRKKYLDQLLPVESPAGSFQSRTWTTLEGTTALLDQIRRECQAQALLPVPADDHSPSLDSKACRKRLGITHWNRKGSTETFLSVGSSIRDLFMTKTPVATPNSESQYSGKNGKLFLKVEISKSDEPTFLSSEARRVNTPPIRSNRTQAGSDRGFFFGLSPPKSEESKSEAEATETCQIPTPASDTLHNTLVSPLAEARQWWHVPVAANEATEEFQPQDFALSVPEHLPSSPLCPMNPMHSSGGNGVCVYHGRKKIGDMLEDQVMLGVDMPNLETAPFLAP